LDPEKHEGPEGVVARILMSEDTGRVSSPSPHSQRDGDPGRRRAHQAGPLVARGTLRYWAAAKAAAGVAEEPYDAVTLQDAVDAAGAAHGPELARVLSRCTFLLDGRQVARGAALPEGAEVEVLPPFAGG
jgi:molybdopterin synthase sulfur carrier subunit